MTDNRYVFFLGNHAALSASEAWRTLATAGLEPKLLFAGLKILAVVTNQEIPPDFIDTLGGTDRIAKVIDELDQEPTPETLADLLTPSPRKASLPAAALAEAGAAWGLLSTERKVRIGLSFLQIQQTAAGAHAKNSEHSLHSDAIRRLGSRPSQRFAIDLKKALKKHGIRCNFITPRGRTTRLNAAAVLFNRLIEPPNCELTIIKTNSHRVPPKPLAKGDHSRLSADLSSVALAKDEASVKNDEIRRLASRPKVFVDSEHSNEIRRFASRYILTQTIAVQDIQSYEKRDTARPARDAKVGMLPPKLAQIMLNMALTALPAGRHSDYSEHSHEIRRLASRLWDPFCGTGVILQEAWLRDIQAYGSDREQRMIDMTGTNLHWLWSSYAPLSPSGRGAGGEGKIKDEDSSKKRFTLRPDLKPKTFLHDATQPLEPSALSRQQAGPRPRRWQPNIIVTEPYLGAPLHSALPDRRIAGRFEELGKLYNAFLKNALPLLTTGGTVAMVLPALKDTRGRLQYMPAAFLDEVEQLGYARVHPVPEAIREHYAASDRQTLVYARPDAIIARELIIWRKV